MVPLAVPAVDHWRQTLLLLDKMLNAQHSYSTPNNHLVSPLLSAVTGCRTDGQNTLYWILETARVCVRLYATLK